jgi:hypothetical protein
MRNLDVLMTYQRILSECVERGGRPEVVIMAMAYIMGEKSQRESAKAARVGRNRMQGTKTRLLLEISQNQGE